MQDLPLFGDGINSYSPIVTAQRRINCFYDIRKDQEKRPAIIRGTPGEQLWQTMPAGIIRGWRVVNSLLYVVSGIVLYSVTSAGVFTQRGTLQNSTGFVDMSDNGVELIIVDGVAGYILTLSGFVFSTITDTNFPAGATTVCFINGRFLVNKTGTRQYYASGSYTGSVWTPVIYATKENRSDLLLAVNVLNGAIVLWGANSIEFWQDVGGSPLPYQRITGSTQTWGLAAVWSRAELDNTMVFLGQNPQGSVQVMKLNGYVPERISTSDIENIINQFSTFNDAVALTYLIDGHPMYQLTFPTGGRSFLFDSSNGLWSEVQTGMNLTARHNGNLGIVFNSINYISDYQNGNIYTLTQNSYTDNGSAIKRQCVSRHIRNGGNTFTVAQLYLDIETGVGLQSGQGSDPKISLEISKNGGRTFGIPRIVSMGKVGQYLAPRVVWRRLGSGEDFVFRFTVTDPVKFTITGGSAVIDPELEI